MTGIVSSPSVVGSVSWFATSANNLGSLTAAPRKLSRAQRFGRRLARKKRAFFGRSTAGYDDCFENLAAAVDIDCVEQAP